MRRRVRLHKLLNLGRQFGRLCLPIFKHHEADGLEQPLVVGRAGHAAFEHGRMLLDNALDLARPNRLPADLQHVVGAARVPEVAVVIDHELVVRVDPFAAKRAFGRLVLVPVAGGDAVAADHQRAHLPRRKLDAVVVNDFRLVAGHHASGAAGAGGPGRISDKNVQDFRGADPVENVEPEPLAPFFEQMPRQGFAGGNTHPHSSQARPPLLLGMVQESHIARRNAVKHGGLKPVDHVEDMIRRGPLGEQNRGASGAQRKIQPVAQPVREEKLGHGKRHIVGAQPQSGRGIGVGGVKHVVLQVDGRFRLAGRAGAIEPEGHVVAMGVGRGQFGFGGR